MAKFAEPYSIVLVESYDARHEGDPRRPVRIRPCAGQGYPTNMNVECSKSLSHKYPVGTIFRIRAKLTDREGGGEFLYSYFGWPVEVVSLGKK